MTVLNIGKLLNLGEPTFLCNVLRLNTCSLQRNNRLYLPKFKCNHYQNNFCFQAPKLWNLLASSASHCNNVTAAPTINALKSRLKRFLLQLQMYGVDANDVEWYDSNKSIAAYLSAIKNKPYSI